MVPRRYEAVKDGSTKAKASFETVAKLMFFQNGCGRTVPYTFAIFTCPFTKLKRVGNRMTAGKYNALTVLNNVETPLHDRMALETINVPSEEATGVHVCLGPIYSPQPQFLDWLDDTLAYNVSVLHAYAAMYSKAEWKRKRFGMPYRPLELYMQRKLHWKVYLPLEDAHYHSQYWMNNDCLFRHRHEAEFLLFIDVDERLHFREGRVPNLYAWLSKMIPANGTGVCGQVPTWPSHPVGFQISVGFRRLMQGANGTAVCGQVSTWPSHFVGFQISAGFRRLMRPAKRCR